MRHTTGIRQWAIAIVVVATGCGDDATQNEPVVLVTPGQNNATTPDTGWSTTSATTPSSTAPGPLFGDCPVEARAIYVVDDSNQLARFDPPSLRFEPLGRLNCPTRFAGNNPFSMSIDREANAWVLYGDSRPDANTPSELFVVNTSTNECLTTKFESTRDFRLFGMGFVVDTLGSQDDVLHIAGSAGGPGDPNQKLGVVNFATLDYEPIGPIEGSPELTGTALGDLWGFFPGTSPPAVARIDRTTGARDTPYPVADGITGQPRAWAFAFWGGDFWLFYMNQEDRSSSVYRLRTEDGSLEKVVSDTGYVIVGAGVSTCAPVEYQ